VVGRFAVALICGVLPAALFIVFFSTNAVAQAEEPDRLGVDAEVHPACRTTFAQAIGARNVRVDNTAQNSVRVAVAAVSAADGGGFRGYAELHANATTTRRELRGATCDEVLDGLAVIVAISLDPQNAFRVHKVAADAGAEPAVSSAGTADASIQTDAKQGSNTAPVAPAKSPDLDLTNSHLPPQKTAVPTRVEWLVGAIGEATSAGPSPTLGGGVQVGFAMRNRALWSPELRVGFMFSAQMRVDVAAGSGRFYWITGRADGCPVHLYFGTPFTLRACVGAEAGTLRGAGSGESLAPNEAQRGWAALRVPVSLTFRPFPAFGVELEGSPVVPLTRYLFAFDRSAASASANATQAVAVYRAPALFAAFQLRAVVFF
jgi:hypothetical protein